MEKQLQKMVKQALSDISELTEIITDHSDLYDRFGDDVFVTVSRIRCDLVKVSGKLQRPLFELPKKEYRG